MVRYAGFTLIELMIVVAIVGILAAVAIPSYRSYTARAQMTEAVSLAAQYKGALANYHSDHGEFATIDFTQLGGTRSGRYVQSVDIANNAGQTITVVATFRSSDVATGLAGKTFSIDSTDGGVSWACGSQAVTAAANPVDSALLPQSCK